MKKLNLMLLAVALTIANFASAMGSTQPTKLEMHLTKEVGLLLKKPSFRITKGKELKAMVTITLNENKEIVVLSVDSESEMVERFIKSRLNYQKIKSKLQSTTIKYFKIPVRVVAS